MSTIDTWEQNGMLNVRARIRRVNAWAAILARFAAEDVFTPVFADRLALLERYMTELLEDMQAASNCGGCGHTISNVEIRVLLADTAVSFHNVDCYAKWRAREGT